jgi:hypothetical protein
MYVVYEAHEFYVATEEDLSTSSGYRKIRSATARRRKRDSRSRLLRTLFHCGHSLGMRGGQRRKQ